MKLFTIRQTTVYNAIEAESEEDALRQFEISESGFEWDIFDEELEAVECEDES